MTFLGLLVVLAFEYVRPNTWVPALAPVGTLLALFVFSLSVISKTENKNSSILKDKNGLLMLSFLGMVTISVLTAEVTEFAFNRFKSVLGYVFLFFMIAKLATDEKRLRILFLVLVALHIVVLILNPKVLLNPETRSYITNAGFLGDGNDFALSLCIVLPMAIFLMQTAKSFWMRNFYIVVVAALVLAIVGTQSRGATLGLAAIFLYQWLRSRNKARGVVVGGAVLALILAFAPAEYFERLNTIKEYESESSAASRLIIWQSAIQMANDNPILGVGAGHFSINFGMRYRPPGETTTSMPWQNAHSIYFMILAELGYPGLLFLLTLFFSNWVGNHRRLRDTVLLPSSIMLTQQRLLISIDSSLIAYAVPGAFLSGIYYPHIFILAGLAAAITLHHQRIMTASAKTANQKENEGAESAEVTEHNQGL